MAAVAILKNISNYITHIAYKIVRLDELAKINTFISFILQKYNTRIIRKTRWTAYLDRNFFCR